MRLLIRRIPPLSAEHLLREVLRVPGLLPKTLLAQNFLQAVLPVPAALLMPDLGRAPLLLRASLQMVES
jgi:hypothetical protein